MNRDIPVQVDYDRTNKGVDVRNSSTANFLIDSEDRQEYNESTTLSLLEPPPTTNSADFSITKIGQNLLSGFFTRIAMSEVSLTWNIYNVRTSTPDLSGNNTTGIAVQVGAGAVTPYTVSIIRGNYTAKDGLDALLTAVNTATGLTFTLPVSSTVGGKRALKAPVGTTFAFYRTTPVPPSPAPFVSNLAQGLGFLVYDSLPLSANLLNEWTANKPNLLAYEYIDITSSQLASQQKVKDATTSAFDSIDVIYRWNFVNDEAYPAEYDAYNYPILPGYKPFSLKRTVSFPKQIRWNPIVPIGNLRFQIYSDKQQVLKYNEYDEAVEFKMLMLVSEV